MARKVRVPAGPRKISKSYILKYFKLIEGLKKKNLILSTLILVLRKKVRNI